MLVEIDNPDWDDNPLRHDLEGWEPWEEDIEDEPRNESGCQYCGPLEDIRELVEPFGGRVCCEGCFAGLIGDESVSPEPWRCQGASDGFLRASGSNGNESEGSSEADERAHGLGFQEAQ